MKTWTWMIEPSKQAVWSHMYLWPQCCGEILCLLSLHLAWGNDSLLLVFMDVFSKPFIQMESYTLVTFPGFFCLACSEASPHCSRNQDVTPFYCQIVLHWLATAHFILLTVWSELFTPFGYCEYTPTEHSCAFRWTTSSLLLNRHLRELLAHPCNFCLFVFLKIYQTKVIILYWPLMYDFFFTSPPTPVIAFFASLVFWDQVFLCSFGVYHFRKQASKHF